MLQRGRVLRCSAAAAQTLTAWLSRLAEQSDALPRANSGGSSTASASSSAVAAQLFSDIESAAAHANALRETDTLFSIFHAVLLKDYYPADAQCWARLAELLLPFGGVEATTVLHYPGQTHAAAGRNTGAAVSSDFPSASSSASAASPRPFHLPITRETLLLTGGVVPLSARVPCGDGRVIAHFLDSFGRYVRRTQEAKGAQKGASSELLSAVRAVSRTVVAALRLNAATLRWELLLPALLDHLRLLHELDLACAATLQAADAPAGLVAEEEGGEVEDERDGEENTVDGSGAAAAPSASSPHPSEGRLLQRMAARLSHTALTHGAHGARVVLYYLNGHFADVVERFRHSDALANEPQEAMRQLYWSQQRYLIALTRTCMRGIYLHYTSESTAAAGNSATTASSSSSSLATLVSRDVVLASPMHPVIESLYDRIDVVLQENVNGGNPLQVEETVLAQLRDIHTLALLRALRLEEAAPDAYLRRALEVVDRVPASMAIEAELIAGKVRLLDLDSDVVDEDGRTAIYNDLLTSLRSLVEMRPRFTPQDGAGDAGDAGDDDEGGSVRLDAVTQSILQRAHADVITAFCASHRDEWFNEAYNIFVTHKYHGLKITKELIRPLLEVFSRRGDCRAFNLVDLCVLYSNEVVDMTTIAFLFRTCAAAGDHYRARTFLQLLNEIIPGFLVKCPAGVRESLRELKLLDPPPRHLFVTADEDLVQSALGEEAATVRRLPDTA